MRKSTWLQTSANVLAVTAIATTGMGMTALAIPATNQTVKLAQGGLVGQCRAVNKAVAVYKQASTTSAVVSTLQVNTQVTLADNGSGGFIGISSPVSGYVQTVSLKSCSGTPTPPPTGNTCRRVIQPLGLSIRKDPSPTAGLVGGVSYLERVDITSTPATAQVSPDGRNWIKIAKPLAGWVSNGFKGGNSNLGLCP